MSDLLRGGQGRTAEDLADTAVGLLVIIAGVGVLAVLGALFRAWGW
ncbi:MAG: hypothetical protein N3A38_12140 [Planctomycetota bacterium]|nr:hypothetical protein [Planctomycetota bacterium]